MQDNFDPNSSEGEDAMPYKINVISQPLPKESDKERQVRYIAIVQKLNGQEIDRDHRLFGVIGKGLSEESAKRNLVRQL